MNLNDSDNIDLWLVDLNQAKNLTKTELNQNLSAYYEQILSAAEHRRAVLMGAQRQQEFILTRGILRELLSSYTAIEPQYLKLAYMPNGKPYLDYDEPLYQIPFSVSHTKDFALYSVIKPNSSHSQTHLGSVGIDLEFKHRPMSIEKMTKLVRRYFTPQEQEIWCKCLANQGMDQQLARSCFLQAWTAKEAYAKATGLGLANTLADLDTSQWFHILPEQALADLLLPDLKIELNQNQHLTYAVRDITPLLSQQKVEYIGAVCWRQANHCI